MTSEVLFLSYLLAFVYFAVSGWRSFRQGTRLSRIARAEERRRARIDEQVRRLRTMTRN